MPETEVTVIDTWAPSVKQREAAEYLAAGYSQLRTAEIIGVDQSRISRWLATEPGLPFAQYVAERRQELVSAQRPLYEQSVSIAQAIVTRALTGEEVDRATYDRAERLLLATLWRTALPSAAIEAERARREGAQLP